MPKYYFCSNFLKISSWNRDIFRLSKAEGISSKKPALWEMLRETLQAEGKGYQVKAHIYQE